MAISTQPIILAAQATISRESAKLLINSWSEFTIVAVTATLEETFKAIETYNQATLVLGNRLAQVGALEVLLEIKRRNLKTRAVILSTEPCPQLERKLLHLPIVTCVQCTDRPERLIEALRAARDGKSLELPSHLEVISEAEDLELTDPLEPLSNREREIFRLLADGLQNAAIAKKLFISPRTVETHRARIVRKLHLHSNADLIRYAIRNGLSAV